MRVNAQLGVDKMRKLIEFLKSSVLLVVTLLVFAVIAELVLRQTSIASFSLNRGFLFSSQPSMISVGDQAVKYTPNTAIREVAVFGTHIEYDITSQSNDFGVFDSVDYFPQPNNKLNIAYLGDSFTAGSGGNKPWVSSLRESVQRSDLNFYNLGVSGTGLQHFEKLLKHAQQKLDIDVVNIMLITDDFFRPLWYPHTADAGVYFCHAQASVKQCTKVDPKMFRIRADETHEKILERTQEQYEYRDIDKDSNRVFHQRLRLFNLFCQAAFNATKSLESLQSISKTCPQLRLYYTLKYKRDALYAQSLDTLQKLSENFPEIEFKVFHMPQKSEVYGGEYSLELADEVKKAGFEYFSLLDLCDWDLSMFHVNDGHPNDSGYLKISECMQKFLPPNKS